MQTLALLLTHIAAAAVVLSTLVARARAVKKEKEARRLQPVELS